MAVFFPELIPVLIVEIAAIILLAVIIAFMIYLLRQWHRSSIPSGLIRDIRKLPLKSILVVLLRTAISEGLIVYPLWRKSKIRWLGHGLAFYGFLGLMITTTLDSIFNPQAYPLSLTDPIKVLGNISGLAVLAGIPIILLRGNRPKGSRGLGDKIFMPTLLLTVVTGFVTEAFSLATIVGLSYIAYVIHLALAIALLGSAPFTRFMHSVLSPYLILFDNYAIKTGREDRLRGIKQDTLIQDLKSLLKKRE